jgi:multicomponent Na+:H+ antiporter subunit E
VSPVLKEKRDGTFRPARLRAVQPAALVWLTTVWVGLWGDVSVANVLSGLLLGVLVSVVFPLPPLRMHLRIRPLRLLWLVLHFISDVVVASVEVTWVILRRRELRNSVIEVNLRTPSDFVLTVVAEMTSLVPGSVVVEARRSDYTLYLHVLDTPDVSAADRMRRRTLELEQRVAAATGADMVHGTHHEPSHDTEVGR